MIASPSTATPKPTALLADRYGTHLERLSHPQKLFVVSVLSEFLRLDPPRLEETLDALDPDAIIPDDLCDALRQLEPCPRRKLIELMLYCLMTLLAES